MMASPAVAFSNGVPTSSPMHLDPNNIASLQSITAATKRKRDSNDDDDKQLNGTNSNNFGTSMADVPSSSPKRTKISRDTVRNYYVLLQRCVTLFYPFPIRCHYNVALPLHSDCIA